MCWFCKKKAQQLDDQNKFIKILKQKHTYKAFQKKQNKRVIKIQFARADLSSQSLLNRHNRIIRNGNQIKIIQIIQKNRQNDYQLQLEGDLTDLIKSQLIQLYSKEVQVVIIQQPQKNHIDLKLIYQQVILGILTAEVANQLKRQSIRNNMDPYFTMKVIVYWKCFSENTMQQIVKNARRK